MKPLTAALSLGAIFLLTNGTASAHEFCVRRYQAELTAVNNEASSLILKQADLDLEAQQLGVEEDRIPLLIQAALTENPPNTQLALELTQRNATINDRQDAITEESFTIKNRLASLQGQLPTELANKLNDCIKESAPATMAVNATLQALAAFTLGPGAAFLPEKALYVDMSEIMKGKGIMGGDKSVPNVVKDAINDVLPKCNGCPKL